MRQVQAELRRYRFSLPDHDAQEHLTANPISFMFESVSRGYSLDFLVAFDGFQGFTHLCKSLLCLHTLVDIGVVRLVAMDRRAGILRLGQFVHSCLPPCLKSESTEPSAVILFLPCLRHGGTTPCSPASFPPAGRGLRISDASLLALLARHFTSPGLSEQLCASLTE